MFDSGGPGFPLGRVSRRSLLAATGALLLSRRLSEAAAGSVYDHRFGRLPNQSGWGAHWFSPHFDRTFDVHGGRGRLRLPAGLHTTAPNQPIPAFLLDHECSDAHQELQFRVTNPQLRPGLLFRRQDASQYLGVTVEHDHLVLASYIRTRRRILARAPVPRLGVGPHVLRVVVAQGRVTAGVWEHGRRARVQLSEPLSGRASGAPGVLVLPPLDESAGSLHVTRYLLSSRGSFRHTTPQTAFAVTGTPIANANSIDVSLRAGADIPATIQFEWSDTVSFRTIQRSAVHTPGPPYTARADINVPANRPLYWRARLVSTSSGVTALSHVHRYVPHRPGDRLVMAAASCAHLWRQHSYDGLHRVLDAAPTEPAIMVYQGDLGYAGNGRVSCYLEARDFYAERFTRTLADPFFERLRRRIPVGFTIDDHDYGQQNNASPAQIPNWAVPLWNQFHADPSDLGYNEFRFGDVQCVTLDGRRYADPVTDPDTPQKTKLGQVQRAWLESLLSNTNAGLVVVYSADAFASRRNLDCFVFGWPDEYRRLMTAFMGLQLRGTRVVILSGDAHGLRIHRHPDPADRPGADGLSVVEFICSGLAPHSWSLPAPHDATLDRTRIVMNHRGLGMIDIDAPGTPQRSLRLRAISGEQSGPTDLFPPLRLSVAPTPDPASAHLVLPRRPAGLDLTAEE